MYVWLCRGVNEATVLASVAAGARCTDDVATACGAGSGCGGCLPSLRRLLGDPNAGDAASPAARGCCSLREAIAV